MEYFQNIPLSEVNYWLFLPTSSQKQKIKPCIFFLQIRMRDIMQLLCRNTWSDVLLSTQMEYFHAWLYLLVGAAPELGDVCGPREPSSHLRCSQAAWLKCPERQLKPTQLILDQRTARGARNTSWKYLSIFADSAGSPKGWC